MIGKVLSVIFLAVMAVITFFVIDFLAIYYQNSPSRLNYPKRELSTSPITNVKSDFNLITTSFGKIPQNAIGEIIFSPDGTKIAYSTIDTNHMQQVYIVDSNGKRSVGETQETIVRLAFSRDSKHLAYLAWRKQNGVQMGTQVIDGKIQGWEKGFGPQLGSEYVPDPHVLSQETDHNPCSNITTYRTGFEGSVTHVIINGYESHGDSIREPIVHSNDCQKVAFVIQPYSANIVVVGDIKGNFKEVSQAHNYKKITDFLPKFSNDGKVIAYGATDKENNIWWVVENLQD